MSSVSEIIDNTENLHLKTYNFHKFKFNIYEDFSYVHTSRIIPYKNILYSKLFETTREFYKEIYGLIQLITYDMYKELYTNYKIYHYLSYGMYIIELDNSEDIIKTETVIKIQNSHLKFSTHITSKDHEVIDALHNLASDIYPKVIDGIIFTTLSLKEMEDKMEIMKKLHETLT